jgi:hypothetical protein
MPQSFMETLGDASSAHTERIESLSNWAPSEVMGL